MKKNIQPIALILTLGMMSSTIIAKEDKGDIEIKPVKVVQPEDKQRQVKGAAIDTESFEIGVLTGFLAVEDFNNNLLYGLSASYHIFDRWMLQLNYGRSEVEKSTFEEVIDSSFLKNSDRNFQYYDLVAGYNIFPGRSFHGSKFKYNSGLYLLAGAGNTSFAGNDNVTLVFGSSYRVVLTDWLTCNLDFRDHIMEREFLGDNKSTHNIALSMGLSVLF